MLCTLFMHLAAMPFAVPHIQAADYGALLPGSTDDAAVWWTHATRKVSRTRPAPEKRSAALEISAAKGEYEPVQLVIRPRHALRRLRATVSDFLRVRRAGGGVRGISAGSVVARIPADNAEILRVHYVNVHAPTDKTGTVGPWPDPLPPLGDGVDVPANANQPLWVLIHVPEDAAAGDYVGLITLEAEGWSAKVPLRLHVWNFALPKESHVSSALGFSAGNVFRYHRLKTDEQKRQVLAKYWQSFAQHRISPYDPAPMDPIRVRFTKDLTAAFDFTAWDKAMTQAFDVYRFNSVRLPVHGMGGGTFHSRVDPSLAGHKGDTPEYKKLFADYAGKLEAHLREKGWLEEAYVYWFDEPAPKDYAFVKAGMARLKQYAPGLRRMLTEQPEEAMFGSVDIWCPITSNYNHERAEARRPHGERFWWYVCTGPKAPWCTLFIDHPATELRVWLWQTWQRKIDGILVWQTNYWTSSTAFPKGLQNPWEDPMSYVSGYSTPAGTKRHWGNGDGRFIYPPMAATGGEGEPVLDGPVSTIRWEMLREGIEDVEYLHRLRELLRERGGRLDEDARKRAEALLEVPPEITTDMTHFTTDGDAIYTHRAKVAAVIERLLGPGQAR